MLGFGLGLNKWRRVGGVSFDPDYQAVLDYATTQGYALPSASQQTAQNQLVLDLKAAGVWTQLDMLHVWRTGDTSVQDFKTIDWIRLNEATIVNAITFVNSGVQGDGVNAYVDLNYNPSTDATNYLLDDHCYGGFNDKNDADGVFISALGATYSEIFNDNANTRFIVFDSSTTSRTPSVSTNAQDGHLMNNRASSADYDFLIDNVAQSKTAVSSVANPNVNFRLFARNNGTFFGNGIASYDFAGSALTTGERAAMITALNTYFAAL
jgi:hypothetical protein